LRFALALFGLKDTGLDYRIDFSGVDWEPALAGTARLKRVLRGGKVFRLVEMTPASLHPEWCEVGHTGMIVEGDIEIDFDGDKTIFHAGDALCIPAGTNDRHRPRALSDSAVMFLIEDEGA
jgi:quercetin dioxygenase-like cupin family protein